MRYPVTKYNCVEQDIDTDDHGEPHVMSERILYEGTSYEECQTWMDNNKGKFSDIDTVIVGAVESW